MSTFTNAKKVPGGYEVLVPDDPGNLAFGTYSRKFIPDDQVTVTNTRKTPVGFGMTTTSYDINVDTTPTTTTSPAPTTASPQPSGDVSSPTMLTETARQPEAPMGDVAPIADSNEAIKQKLETQFRQQYENLAQGGYRYQGRQSDLDKIFKIQAENFANAGFTSIYQAGKGVDEQGREVIINKTTGEPFRLPGGSRVGFLEPRGDYTRMGYQSSNIEGMVNFGVEFDNQGNPMYFPVYEDTSSGIGKLLGTVAPFALMAIPGIGSLASSLGATFASGASAAAQQAIGNAILSGATTGVITGDVEKALISGALVGGGSYLYNSGALGDTLNEVGLSGVTDTFNIPVSESALGADPYSLNYAPETEAISQAQIDAQPGLFGDAEFALPTEGVSLSEVDFSQIPGIGESALGMRDFSVGDIQTLPRETLLPTLDQSGLRGFTLEDLEKGRVPLEDVFPSLAQEVATITSPAAATGLLTGRDVLETAEETGIIEDIKQQLPEGVKDFFSDLNIKELVGAGFDIAAINKIADEYRKQGARTYEEALRLGREAGVTEFKPYTVTTGLGTARITPEEAVAEVGAGYAPIREAALGAAEGMITGLPTTREEATAQQLAATRALTEPFRQREQERMLSTLAQRGLLGYGQTLPGVDGARRVSPIAESVLSAQEVARAQEALEAQRFGLTEAQRLANLATGLTGEARAIDTAALKPFEQARMLAGARTELAQQTAGRAAEAGLAGLRLQQQYDVDALRAQAGGYGLLSEAARGVIGAPTQPGNVPMSQSVIDKIAEQVAKQIGKQDGLFGFYG